MSPKLNSAPLARHPQRPWRPIESSPRRPQHIAERKFCAPVVRELPLRGAQREPAGTW